MAAQKKLESLFLKLLKVVRKLFDNSIIKGASRTLLVYQMDLVSMLTDGNDRWLLQKKEKLLDTKRQAETS